MDSIEFLAIIAILTGILGWYIHNVRTGSDGHAGLFALRQETGVTKPAPARSRHQTTLRAVNENGDTSDKMALGANLEGQSQRMFRRRKEARYRVMDRAARYRPQKRKTPL